MDAWLDRMRVELDPAPPPLSKKLEPVQVLIAGMAAGILVLLGGSIYWFSGKKDEAVPVAASGTSIDAARPSSVPIGASAPAKEEAPTSEVAFRAPRVPRVTEEAPTLPLENDSSSALRLTAKVETRANNKEPDQTNSMGSRLAGTEGPAKRIEVPKPEEPKTARREPTPASDRSKPDKPVATKLALAEQVAAPVPVPSEAVASEPSAPMPVIAMPRFKSMRAPDYPDSEMRAGNEGSVTLELLVLESGLVGEVTVMSSSGYPRLDAAAVAVAKKSWRFFPATENGKPTAMKIEAPVRFTLD